MCARDTRRTEHRTTKASSVVGSRLSEVTSSLPGRSLLRGKLRDQEGLKIVGSALRDRVSGDANESVASRVLRIVVIVSGVLLVLLLSIAIAIAILSTTGAFEITSVTADDSEHVKGADIVQLANVEDGATLLNVNASAIEKNVQRNPWVASVEVQRVFPSTINLKVTERTLGSVVAMGSGGLAWLMGDDQVWIEPLRLEVGTDESANDEALKQAAALGAVLISDVPSSVQPAAGTPSTDKSILAVFSLMSQLSTDFRQRILCYSASSEDDISCLLDNGIEISFGTDSTVSTKEAVAQRILDEYTGQVTYINVRVPTRPTYRRVKSEYVKEGTGATGSAVDKESVLPGKNPSSRSDKTSAEGTTKDSANGDEDEVATDGYDSYDDGYSEDYDYSDSYDYESDASYYGDDQDYAEEESLY